MSLKSLFLASLSQVITPRHILLAVANDDELHKVGWSCHVVCQYFNISLLFIKLLSSSLVPALVPDGIIGANDI